ncbi:hypothetical protein RP20_CCG009317 [Aedes albopictus]|nr:hypothetical protein RP20_CCG009317 [Aedes albopictus]
MRTFAACLVFSLCAMSAAFAADNLDHYFSYKEFDAYFRECGEYYEVPNCTLDEYIANAFPNEPEVQKLIHCTMIIFKGWQDGSGVVEYVMSDFFNPAPEDTCYADRTRECIQNSPAPCDTNTTLAYKAFQCYYRQYGNLNQSRQFMPYTCREVQVLFETSIAIVNVPRCELINYSNGQFLDQPNFADVMYVIFVRGGFYDMNLGLSLRNLYTQCGKPELLTPETQQCVDAATAAWDGQKRKDLIYAIFVNCLQKTITFAQELQVVATSMVTGQPVPCPPPTTPPPPSPCTTSPPPPSTVPPCYNV